MPKEAIDYSKAVSIKYAVDAEIEDIYVGSTTDLVKRRNDTRTHATILSQRSTISTCTNSYGSKAVGKTGKSS
jgi:hypothetical protein